MRTGHLCGADKRDANKQDGHCILGQTPFWWLSSNYFQARAKTTQRNGVVQRMGGPGMFLAAHPPPSGFAVNCPLFHSSLYLFHHVMSSWLDFFVARSHRTSGLESPTTPLLLDHYHFHNSSSALLRLRYCDCATGFSSDITLCTSL